MGKRSGQFSIPLFQPEQSHPDNFEISAIADIIPVFVDIAVAKATVDSRFHPATKTREYSSSHMDEVQSSGNWELGIGNWELGIGKKREMYLTDTRIAISIPSGFSLLPFAISCPGASRCKQI